MDPTNQPAQGLDVFRGQVIRWLPCQDGGAARGSGVDRCGSVRVPVDHLEPRGETVQTTLRTVPAGDPTARNGTLFINPGGRGASGLEFAMGARDFSSVYAHLSGIATYSCQGWVRTQGTNLIVTVDATSPVLVLANERELTTPPDDTREMARGIFGSRFCSSTLTDTVSTPTATTARTRSSRTTSFVTSHPATGSSATPEQSPS